MGSKLLMIDCGVKVKWDVSTAVRRVQAMEEYGLAWIEEPLGAWDPEGYANLRAKTSTLIRLWRTWNGTARAYEQVLATGTVDVIGVDPGRAEGITGFKKYATGSRPTGVRRMRMHGRRPLRPRRAWPYRSQSPACKLFELKPLRNQCSTT